MKKYISIIILFFLVSCDQRIKTLFAFQEANKIEYYKIKPEKEPSEDKELSNVVYSYDCRIQGFEIEKTIILNYNKTDVAVSLNGKLIEYFAITESQYQQASFSMAVCAPIYRDILVFKRDDKIIGIVKLCFSCSHNFVITQKKCAENINLDYSSLNDILKQLASR